MTMRRKRLNSSPTGCGGFTARLLLSALLLIIINERGSVRADCKINRLNDIVVSEHMDAYLYGIGYYEDT